MAIRQRTRSLVGYGLDNALQGLAPQPIIANRAPTTSDTAPLGSRWVWPAQDEAWVLVSNSNATATWNLIESSGAAGVFSSLLVNPGPVTTQGTGAVNISADAVATTVNVGTGAAVKTVTVGSLTGGSVTTIQGGSTGGMIIETGNGNLIIDSGTGDLDISTDATTSAVNVGTGAGVKTTTLGSTHTSSATTVQAGSGKVQILDNGNVAGAITLLTNGGTTETITITNTQGTAAGAIALSASAGGITGAAAGKISLTSTDNAAGAITIEANGGATETVLIESAQGTSATAVNIVASAGGITLNSDLTLALTSVDNNVTMSPATPTAASPTAAITNNSRVIAATFTGFTTAAATQAFTITSSAILATSGVFVTVTNASAGNDAKMTLTSVTQAVGSVVVNTTNNGTQSLDSTVHVNVWIIS